LATGSSFQLELSVKTWGLFKDANVWAECLVITTARRRDRSFWILRGLSGSFVLPEVVKISDIHQVSPFIYGEFLGIEVSPDFEMEFSDPLICGSFLLKILKALIGVILLIMKRAVAKPL